MKFYLLICLMMIFVFGANVSAQKNDKQTQGVLQALKKYDDAWNKKDAKTLSEILAPEYVYFSSTGELSDRQETLDFLVSPKYVLTFAERSEIKTFRNGETVIVSSHWKGKGTFNEQAINDDQLCGQVFVKNGKHWKLLSEHCVHSVSK